LETSVWHTLVLGAVEHNRDLVTILVSVHDAAYEKPSAIPLALSQNAASAPT